VYLLVLLLKPTQLILIPFMLSAVVAQGRWRTTLVGGVAFGLILSLGYSLQWGWQGWILAHHEWFAFLPLSEAKHILRSDNFGLTTQLVRGLGEWVPAPLISKLMLGCGLAAALAGLRRSPPLSQGMFVDALFMSIVCSPMAWRQNFSPLFLMLSWAVLRSRGLSRARMGVFWCCSVAFGVLASDILGPSGAELFGRWGGPLWLAIIAWWSARPALRPDAQLSATF